MPCKKVIGFSKRLRIVDLSLPYHRTSVMTIIWKDPHMRLHGKRHKTDSCYYRWHYGKQRRVWISKEYVDRPTEKQVSAREAFTALRREVARQLRDADLRAEWLRRFEADNEGYKMLHTYVYAMMKRGERVAVETRRWCVSDPARDVGVNHETHHRRVSTVNPHQETRYMAGRGAQPVVVILYNGHLLPLFLPNVVPKIECLRVC